MLTLEELRNEELRNAMHKLKYTVIPNLESVIAGTPTGPVRDKLTEANIILQSILYSPSQKGGE